MSQFFKKVFQRYFSEKDLRDETFLCISLAMNGIYAVFGWITGIREHSLWFAAVAFYYFLLGGMKFFLLRRHKEMEVLPSDAVKRQEYSSYRSCGVMMLVLNVAMTGMVVQLIQNDRQIVYPWYLIYLSAAFAFFCFGSSAFHMIRPDRKINPIFQAVKSINFVSSLMSIFILQTALISAFGSDPDFKYWMNTVFGGVICLICVCTAIWMIYCGNKKVRELGGAAIACKKEEL